MKDKNLDKIRKIIEGLYCPKDFRCSENGFKNLCKAEDFGNDKYLICLEEDSFNCHFAIPFEGKKFCQCPLRVYLAKKFKK